jgi:predicted TPR repeat methyltransferase
MSIEDHIIIHNKFAENYDQQVKEYNSYGHDVLFGMSCEFVKPGDTLLDLGIGTGLSSAHFAGMGLEITGMDGSGKMLEQCRKKDFARNLIQYDITRTPYPFPEHSFDHVICCGVFHFFGNLNPILTEVKRLLKSGGVFGFTVAGCTKKEEISGKYDNMDYMKVPTAWGVPIYQHTDKYIKRLVDSSELEIQKIQKILSDSGDNTSDDLLFKIFVCRKK